MGLQSQKGGLKMKYEYFYQTDVHEEMVNGRCEVVGDSGYRFFYEPSDEEERDAMEEIIYETYFKAEGDTAEMKEMKKMGVRDMLLDDIIIYSPFEEDLRAYFMQDAYEAFENGEVDAVYEP